MDHEHPEPSTDAPRPDLSKQDREALEAWLSTPESDEPVPDFVERELEKPFEIDLSEWAPVKPSPDFAERVVRAVFAARYQRVRAAMRREKNPVPPKDKLEPGLWRRDAWFSVARAGVLSLRAQHRTGGWHARLRCYSSVVHDLLAPLPTRREAESAILEIAAAFAATIDEAMKAVDLSPPPDAPQGPFAKHPRWHLSPVSPGVVVSEVWCGAFWLVVYPHEKGHWEPTVLCDFQPIFAAKKIATREQGQEVALAGARMRLVEIDRALAALRAGLEPPPPAAPEPVTDRPPESL